MITEISNLPLLERMQKYHAMADAARRKAHGTHSQAARQSYVVLAQHWEALATVAALRLATEEARLLE